jgi:DNA ligase-4
MIVLYNVMLLDDLFCARQNQDKRRDLLERLVYRISGQAEVGSRQVIRFSSTDAAESLRKAFSNAIAQRWEGLVLKGCHDPSPSFCQDTASVKLKKDCIPGLGDTADIVILELFIGLRTHRLPAQIGAQQCANQRKLKVDEISGGI